MSGMNPILSSLPQGSPAGYGADLYDQAPDYLLRIAAGGGNYFNGLPVALDSFLDHSRIGSATYQDSNDLIQTAAGDELRYDYSTGARRILLEGQQTNLLTYSDDLTGYTAGNVSVSPSDFSPVAGRSGKRVTETAASGTHAMNSPTVTIAAGLRYFFGYFVRDAGRRYVQIPVLSALGGETRYANFDVQAGVCTYVGSNSTPVIKKISDGYIVGITFVAGGSTQDRLSAFMIPSGNAGRFASYTGDGVSALDVTGFMVYQGYPSSYIPTSGSAVTRSPDIATVDISSLDLTAGFTVLYEGSIVGTGRVFQLGTTGNHITLRSDGTNLIFEVYSGGVLQAIYTSSGITLGDNFKFSARVETNNVNAAFNGTAGAADTNAAFVEPDTLNIASSDGTSLDKPAQLHITELRIDTPLSDSEMEALTA